MRKEISLFRYPVALKISKNGRRSLRANRIYSASDSRPLNGAFIYGLIVKLD